MFPPYFLEGTAAMRLNCLCSGELRPAPAPRPALIHKFPEPGALPWLSAGATGVVHDLVS